jgi:putative transposase
MEVFSIAKGFYRLVKHAPPELSDKEINKLRALRLFSDTKDANLVCRTFEIGRATLYRWLKRFNPMDLSTLKELSRRPKKVRTPQWSYELMMAVKKLRKQYPRWGKEKIAVLLKGEGFNPSSSTVGRIIAHLKKHGDLVEPKIRSISFKKKIKRPYAIRKPKEYMAAKPGDLVEVDTMDVRPVAGVILKQFTARDVISKWDVVEVRSRATAKAASEFIDTLQRRMPFAIKAIQVDGGSEFFADFERLCKARSIQLFVLPPKSPKLNGAVERSNRTHTEEFYEITECSWKVAELNQQLRHQEYVYNCIRPHQALKYLTPLQFLKNNGIIETNTPSHLSHMY